MFYSLPRHLFPRAALLALVFGAGSCSLLLAQEEKDPLAAGFAQPPASARPRTWWHWVSGNVSKEGITADLEAMKQIGLAGAQIFTVDQSDVHGPIKFMSPEWLALVRHALSEAHRLNLEISMEGCDGWSESGGPWVQPPEGMQKIAWSERRIEGGQKVALDLPRPVPTQTYYEDIALYAFSSLEGTAPPAKITSSDPKFTPPAGETGARMAFENPTQPQWLQVEYAQPVRLGSVSFDIKGQARHSPAWEAQASDDGVHFRKLGSVLPGLATFPAATARYFRLWRPNVTPQTAALTLTSARFSGTQLPLADDRAGFRASISANEFSKLDLAPGEAIDPKALVDLTGRHDWQAPPGRWTLLRLGHFSTGTTTHPSTHPGLECDKLSAAAVTHHIENLFDPVFAGSPELVGSTFKYILLDSWEAGCENWTPHLAAEFKRRRGYDLIPWLPALTRKIVGSAELTQRFLWDYRRTLADLVAEEHYGTIQQFAHAHGMGLTSEASGNGMPTIADQLLCKKYTDIPMGEFWVSNSGDANIDDPKEAACAAHLYGQNIAATESFTSTPNSAAWRNDPYSLKALGDQEFCLGVNRFVFHRYAHQPWLDRKPGMSMGPWGINFERTNTWWEPGAAWISYLSRCQYLLQQGRFQADLCYFYGEGAPICVRRAALLPAPPAGFDYDVCNADVLLNLMRVENGRIVLPSGMSYRVLVLPGGERMTLPVLEKLQSLIRDGATVYGSKPTLSPSLTGYPADEGKVAKLADEIWGSCDGVAATEHAYGKGKIAFGQPLEKLLAAPPDFTAAQPGLLFIHRAAAPAEIYFVSNQQPREVTTDCTFRVTGKIPELWDAATGEHETVALYSSENGCTTLPLHLDPIGSKFVIFREPASGSSPASDLTFQGHSLRNAAGPLAATFPVLTSGRKTEFTAFQPGTYELIKAGQPEKLDVPALPAPQVLAGPWQLTFPPKSGAPPAATFASLISWPDSQDDGIKYFSGTATYRTDFTLPGGFAAPDRRLFLDLGAVKNLADVTLNGHSLGVLWKEPFRVDVTGALQEGANHLEIKVTNLWPNRLIGDQRLPADQRTTWTSFNYYKADSPLLPSGLLGPVRIVPGQTVTAD